MKARNVTPLSFSENGDRDDQAKEARMEQSTTMWIKKKPLQIENRQKVIEEMRNFALVIMGKNLGPTPPDEGKPEVQEEEEEQDEGSPSKKPRRDFGHSP